MKHFFTISLAILILTMSMGFTFSTHYCDGKAVMTTLTLGYDDVDCGMENMGTPCNNKPSEGQNVKRGNCCENKYTQVAIEDDYNTPKIVESANEIYFIEAFVVTYINLFSFKASAGSKYKNYSPPLLTLDIPVLTQSFLI